MEINSFIEAVLFFKGEPMARSVLERMFGVGKAELEEELLKLEEKLEGRGLVLVRDGEKVMMGTHPKASGFIEGLLREDLEKDIGKAGLETLTIILYRGPISRSQIDYVRGVNSSYILKHLLMRGLIEKSQNMEDRRSVLYRPTTELLSYLGVGKPEDMPRYKETREKLELFDRYMNTPNEND